jgi:hypothetical protein
MSEADWYHRLAAKARHLAKREARVTAAQVLRVRAIIYDARALLAESDNSDASAHKKDRATPKETSLSKSRYG